MNFLSLLTLLFIGLKLSGAINWSWWLVLMPLYLPVWTSFVLIIIVSWLTENKTNL